MKTRTAKRLLAAVVAAVVAVVLVMLFVNWVNSPTPPTSDGGAGQPVSNSSTSAAPKSSAGSTTKAPSTKPTKRVPNEKFGLPVIRESALPPEGRDTLELIRDGGPYPYSRDGVNFGNFEGLLPKKRGGFYAEYTVPTPGENDRGARRIIVGDDGTKFYTDDHYESFFYIQEDA